MSEAFFIAELDSVDCVLDKIAVDDFGFKAIAIAIASKRFPQVRDHHWINLKRRNAHTLTTPTLDESIC